jgi:hypothetical protein
MRRLSRNARSSLLIFPLFALSISGCHTFRFEVRPEEPAASVVHERNSYFLFALVPTRELDVRARCPHGVVRIEEQMGFVDGLAEFFTLGIWSLRSTWYHCAAAPEGGE